jgi:non-specific serine/threonine protein kinase
MAETAGRFRFGSFELQLEERLLLRDGDAVALRPRAFDLLVALLDRCGRLVTKDELLERVWPGVVVEEAALHVQVSALRKALGADAIATVSGHGYRFVLPVTKVEPAQLARKHNLPSQLTSFIGREHEIDQLKKLLATDRLITLTGAGGAGKTRLAIEAAAQVAGSFPDGVCLVELASLSEASLVLQTLLRALGLSEQPARPLIDTITDDLAAKRLLLVLDNAEHLLDACVQLVDRIGRFTSKVVILVTSRQRLGLAGERTYRVPSLTVPDRTERLTPEKLSSYEGARLFVERARLVRPDFEVTASNAAAVGSVCDCLDGIPLAIELAAPRLASMSVEELSQRLDRRFALLTGGSPAALPRQRTLRSTIDWSHDLLTSAEQAMLSRVSVFAGGWLLAAAEQVCTGDGIAEAEVIDLLAALVDKSLVVTGEHDGATRYRLLETVRQYAQDRLRERGEEAASRSRHLAFVMSLVHEAWGALRGPGAEVWLGRLDAEHDNLRAALAWSIAAEPQKGLELAGLLYRFWFIRGHLSEGREWLTRVLDATPRHAATEQRARALCNAGILSRTLGDHAEAQRLHEDSLALNRKLNDVRGIATNLGNLAIAAMDQLRFADAESLWQEAVTIVRAVGDRVLLAVLLANLGYLSHLRGHDSAARPLFEESLSIHREFGDRSGEALALGALGMVEFSQGDPRLGEQLVAKSLAIFSELGVRISLVQSLESLGLIAAAGEVPQRAASILGAAQRLREEMGAPLPPYDEPFYRRAVTAARSALGDSVFDAAWNEGREMTLEGAVRYALSKDE